MGSTFGRLQTLMGRAEKSVLLLGLENSGKTTLLHWLKHNEPRQDPLPSIGFSIEKGRFRELVITAWDVGQESKLSAIKRFMTNVHAIVFIVDASDREQLGLARKELFFYLGEFHVPLLVLTNKKDSNEVWFFLFFIFLFTMALRYPLSFPSRLCQPKR